MLFSIVSLNGDLEERFASRVADRCDVVCVDEQDTGMALFCYKMYCAQPASKRSASVEFMLDLARLRELHNVIDAELRKGNHVVTQKYVHEFCNRNNVDACNDIFQGMLLADHSMLMYENYTVEVVASQIQHFVSARKVKDDSMSRYVIPPKFVSALMTETFARVTLNKNTM